MSQYKKGFINSPVSISIAIIIIAILGYGIYFLNKNSKSQESVGLKTYENSSISFQYPSILSQSETKNGVRLSHFIPYKHFDPCDLKGDVEKQLDNLTDFDVTINVIDKNLLDYIKSASWPSSEYVLNNPYSFGKLSGYHITPGVEGCGEDIYYFKIGDSKTLTIKHPFVSEFNVINQNNQMYKDIPGIISEENSKKYIEGILSSIEFK